MRHVQTPLILVALVAVLLVGCSSNDSADSTTTAVPTSALATTTLGSTTTSVPVAVGALLANDDLPSRYGWVPVPIEEEFWDEFGIMVRFCEDQWNVLSEPSLRELTVGMPMAVSFDADGAHVHQVVYANTSPSTQVEVAFDDVARELDECISWWEQNPATGIVDEYVEKGWHWAVQRFELPTSGVESYGITYHTADADGVNVGADWWANHTLVMVRTETHLMVLELYGNSNADELQGIGFASIVDSALEQLSSA